MCRSAEIAFKLLTYIMLALTDRVDDTEQSGAGLVRETASVQSTPPPKLRARATLNKTEGWHREHLAELTQRKCVCQARACLQSYVTRVDELFALRQSLRQLDPNMRLLQIAHLLWGVVPLSPLDDLPVSAKSKADELSDNEVVPASADDEVVSASQEQTAECVSDSVSGEEVPPQPSRGIKRRSDDSHSSEDIPASSSDGGWGGG